MKGTLEAVLAEAAKEIGYTESPAGSNRTKFANEAGHANGQPWCATFLVAIFRRQGLKLPSESAYTPHMAQGFRYDDAFLRNPKVGDIAFFDFPDSKNRIQHVGIVEKVEPAHVVCIEGNTSPGTSGSQDNGGGVYRRRRSRSHVVGYGRPRYVTIRKGAIPDMLIVSVEGSDKLYLYSGGKLVHLATIPVVQSHKDAGVPQVRWTQHEFAQASA